MEKFRFRREIERNWFSNRVVDEWNGLSNHIVSVKTITVGGWMLKRKLVKLMDEDDGWN